MPETLNTAPDITGGMFTIVALVVIGVVVAVGLVYWFCDRF